MRLMGLDVGKRRIGIAVSDILGITVRPHSTLERAKLAPDQIAKIAGELEVEKIIVGLPLHLDGTEGAQAEDVRHFVTKLTKVISLPVEFKDERLSTVEAEYRLSDRRVDWRKRKGRIDAVAAAIILEDYLKER